MIDIDGKEVKLGDIVKVLLISDRTKKILVDDEKPHILSMLGNDYEIDEFVNNKTQISVSYLVRNKEGCLYVGLYLYPHEFRLVRKKSDDLSLI